MLGLSSAGVRFGPPTTLTVMVGVGLVLLAAGLIGLGLTTRRLNALQRSLPPLVPQGAPQQFPPMGPQQMPYGVPPQQAPYGVQPQQPPYGGPPQQTPYGVPPPQQVPYGVPPRPVVPVVPPAVRRAQSLRGFAIAAVVVGLLALGVHTEVRPDARISVPDVAGGVRKVPTPPAVEEDAQGKIRNGTQLIYATYEHPKYPAAKNSAETRVMVFYGLEGNNEPAATIDRAFTALKRIGPLVNGISEHPGGRANEKIHCGSVQRSAVEVHCFWADSTTFGHLYTGEITEPELAALLARMRPDLER